MVSGSSDSEETACPSTAAQPTCLVTCPQTRAIPRQTGQALWDRPAPGGVAERVFKRLTCSFPRVILPSALSPPVPAASREQWRPADGRLGRDAAGNDWHPGGQATNAATGPGPARAAAPFSPFAAGMGLCLGRKKRASKQRADDGCSSPWKHGSITSHSCRGAARLPPAPAAPPLAACSVLLAVVWVNRSDQPQGWHRRSCMPGHGQHPVLQYGTVQEGLGQGHHVYPFPVGERRDAPGPAGGVFIRSEAEVTSPARPGLLHLGRIRLAVCANTRKPRT